MYAKGSTYLIVKGVEKWGGWVLSGFTTRKTKPSVGRDEIAIKLELKLPAALFQKPLLAASIDIDGDVPVMDISSETVQTIEEVIRAQSGLDVQLSVVSPDD